MTTSYRPANTMPLDYAVKRNKSDQRRASKTLTGIRYGSTAELNEAHE